MIIDAGGNSSYSPFIKGRMNVMARKSTITIEKSHIIGDVDKRMFGSLAAIFVKKIKKRIYTGST